MDFKSPEKVRGIINKFQENGFQLYLVGGAVRDLLMQKKVADWDFTTDAKPEEILKIFPDGFYDNKFGTVGIPLGGETYEVTTMRKEGAYQDSRHPVDVYWTNKIEEDLNRRDFTINAMAMDLNGKIIDPYSGQRDLEEKIIKTVGDANKRFREDALRLIRAVRIATQLNFGIEPKTLTSIKENSKLIENIASERIRDELFKVLSTNNPTEGIIKLRETGILKIILPELERCFGLSQEGPKHDRVYDIGQHSLDSLKSCPSLDPLVRFAALLHDIGKPDTAKVASDKNVTFYNHDVVGGKLVLKIAKRFNLSKKQADKLYRLVRWHMFTLDEKQTDSSIRRFIKNVGIENIEDIMAVRVADRLGGGTVNAVSWRMEEFQKRIKEVLQKPFSISDLKINGNDVMKELNIKPGPKVGEILEKLFKEVQKDSSKNNQEYLLKRVRKI